MTFERSMIGDAHVLTPTGKLSAQDALLAIIDEVAAAGPAKVVVDLGNISWINSVGFGGLLRANKTCENSHGWLRLARAAEIMKTSRACPICLSKLAVFETVEEAVAAGETGYNQS